MDTTTQNVESVVRDTEGDTTHYTGIYSIELMWNSDSSTFLKNGRVAVLNKDKTISVIGSGFETKTYTIEKFMERFGKQFETRKLNIKDKRLQEKKDRKDKKNRKFR